MALTCMAQFVYQKLGYGISRQDRAAPKRAHRHEIDWKLNPYTIKTLQVLVHPAHVVAKFMDSAKAAADDRGYN